jgi:hypothetical protein
MRPIDYTTVKLFQLASFISLAFHVERHLVNSRAESGSSFANFAIDEFSFFRFRDLNEPLVGVGRVGYTTFEEAV